MKDRTILITRPNYDQTTSYLHHWSQALIDNATSKGAKVIDIAGPKVTRKEFESRIKKMIPDLMLLNGHGASDRLAGQDHEVILDKDNAEITKGSLVYALSCDSAAQLGPTAVTKGTKSYIGYRENFIFWTERDKSTQPLKDKSAELFLRPAFSVSKALLKGNTASVAISRARREFDKSIAMASSSDVQSDFSSYVRFLLWDKIHLTYSGNGNASV